MKQRCYNLNSTAYKYYGNRGIIICEEWKNNFISFYNWGINNGYCDDLTIDRIDNNGNYESTNCRWVSQKIQVSNQSNNSIMKYLNNKNTESVEIDFINNKNKKYYLYNNKMYTIPELAKKINMSKEAFYYRIKKGLSIDEIMSIEKAQDSGRKNNGNANLITINNETHSLKEWCKIYNFTPSSVQRRVKKGMTIEEAILTPHTNTNHLESRIRREV
jgi:hypothetical protein